MAMHAVALVTILAVIMFVWTMTRVGSARIKFDIKAPATTGHPEFERHFRVHGNTLEALAMFLPSLWLFAIYMHAWAAVVLGAIWIAARILYALGYSKAAESRLMPFAIGGFANLVLLLGALAGIVLAMLGMKLFG